MAKKILTLEQLWNFCKQNQLQIFNSNDSGYKLAVQVPAVIKFEEDSNKDKSKDGLLFMRVKVCHIGVNRNHSKISEENMRKAMPSLKYRPLLGSIIQLDDGTYDFHSHDMVVNDDGIEYIEKQIGSFTEKEPFLEYDANYDKTYVIAEAAIPEDYTMAADIIRRKDGTKVSCELLIENMQFDTSDNTLDLIDFRFSGVCALGSEKNGDQIEEGMYGSRADIIDFSEKNNSVCSYEYTDLLNKFNELNDKVNKLFDSTITKEGGNDTVDKKDEIFEEVTENVADTTEETVVKENEAEGDTVETPVVEESFDEEDADAEVEDPGTEDIENPEEHSVEEHEEEPEGTHPVEEHEDTREVIDDDEPIRIQNEMTRTYAVSHDDIRSALYVLIAQYEEIDNSYYWINSVYNDYFVFSDYSKYYGQKYKVENDNVTLDGERYALHAEFLTDSEYAKLNEMRNSYTSMLNELSTYKKEKEDAEKDAMFELQEYASISTNEEFIALKDNHAEFSVESLREKLDSIQLKAAKEGTVKFALVDDKPRKRTVAFASSFEADEDKKKEPYGGIFKKYKKK